MKNFKNNYSCVFILIIIFSQQFASAQVVKKENDYCAEYSIGSLYQVNCKKLKNNYFGVFSDKNAAVEKADFDTRLVVIGEFGDSVSLTDFIGSKKKQKKVFDLDIIELPAAEQVLKTKYISPLKIGHFDVYRKLFIYPGSYAAQEGYAHSCNVAISNKKPFFIIAECNDGSKKSMQLFVNILKQF
jgi:hypothetical protein